MNSSDFSNSWHSVERSAVDLKLRLIKNINFNEVNITDIYK